MLPGAALLFAAAAGAAGPYKVVHKTYTNSGMDITSKKIEAVYPQLDPNDTARFPVISYAHGDSDGNGNAMKAYGWMFEEIASYGYVVVAPCSCTIGCLSDCRTILGDPPCFGDFYKEQLKALDWARAEPGLPVDPAAGAGVAGHSMGGQATLLSAALNATDNHGIRAAVMHHAYTHASPPPAPQVPFLAFTGTKDTVASPQQTERFFGAAGACPAKGLVNKVGATHGEPDVRYPGQYNPNIANYTIAWFKLHIEKTPQAFGVDFDRLIFGNGTDSMCGGDDGGMQQCTVSRG